MIISLKSELCALVVSTSTAPRIIKSKRLTQGSEQVIVARCVANILSLVRSPVLVKKVSKNTMRLPKKMLTALDAESATQWVHFNNPSGPINGEGTAGAVYKQNERKRLQMPKEWIVTIADGEMMYWNWRHQVKIAACHL